jgi:hypothetical protein
VEFKTRNPFRDVLTGWFLIAAVTAPSVPAAADGFSLRPYTTPDNTASAGIPDGWKVSKGDHSVIVIAGPHGDEVTLGFTVITLDAGPGAQPPTPKAVDFNLPYATGIKDKYVAIWQHYYAAMGKDAPQLTFASGTLLHVPPILGQCARATGSFSDSNVPTKFEVVMCSLPPDSAGAYKNIIISGKVPASLAAQERPLIEAVMKSYRVPRAELAKKLGPVYATPRVPVGALAHPYSPTEPDEGAIWRRAGALDDSVRSFSVILAAVRSCGRHRRPRNQESHPPEPNVARGSAASGR